MRKKNKKNNSKFPNFGCEAVKDICNTCIKLNDKGHCEYEKNVNVIGCDYYENKN